jgi:hypothetical protein
LQRANGDNLDCTLQKVASHSIRSRLVEKIRYFELKAKDYDVKIKMRKFTQLDGDPRPDQSHQDFMKEAQDLRDNCLAKAKLARAELVSFDNLQANLSQLASSSCPVDNLVLGPLLHSSLVYHDGLFFEPNHCCRVEAVSLELKLGLRQTPRSEFVNSAL